MTLLYKIISLLGFVFMGSLCFGLRNAQRAQASEFPAQVQFTIDVNRSGVRSGDNDVTCTATKIGPNTFITAAHCLVYLQQGQSTQITQKDSILRLSEKRRFQNIVIFKDYKNAVDKTTGYLKELYDSTPNTSFDNELKNRGVSIIERALEERHQLDQLTDLAIFSLDQDISDVPCLALSKHSLQRGNTILLAGYGKADNGIGKGLLHTGPSMIHSRGQVQSKMTKSMVHHDKQAYPTHGDSGGPVLLEENNKQVLVGVISNGDTHTVGQTRTDNFVRLDRREIKEWIKNNSQGDCVLGTNAQVDTKPKKPFLRLGRNRKH